MTRAIMQAGSEKSRGWKAKEGHRSGREASSAAGVRSRILEQANGNNYSRAVCHERSITRWQLTLKNRPESRTIRFPTDHAAALFFPPVLLLRQTRLFGILDPPGWIVRTWAFFVSSLRTDRTMYRTRGFLFFFFCFSFVLVIDRFVCSFVVPRRSRFWRNEGLLYRYVVWYAVVRCNVICMLDLTYKGLTSWVGTTFHLQLFLIDLCCAGCFCDKR